MNYFSVFKPPIGICPRWFWLENLEIPYFPSTEEKIDRVIKLKGAIERYENWDFITMKEYGLVEQWEQELKDLIK